MAIRAVTTNAGSKNHALQQAERGMRTTLLGIGANLVLAVGKGAAGVLGHSYALVADAIESGTDVFSSVLVYIGLQVAARPADENHPQGHGKAEALAAVAVSLFLFGAAINIALQSIHEILVPHTMPAPWTLAVLAAVVLLKELLFRHVHGVGEAVGSTAVTGDAFHHRSDALTSVAAFIGISAALIGSHFSPDPRWSSADDWAALAASVVVGANGWVILRRATQDLTDARPDGSIEEDVRAIALTVGGVECLDKCVVRKMGFDYYVELDVMVDPMMPVCRAHEIAHAVQDTVRARVNSVHIERVLVHIEPADGEAN